MASRALAGLDADVEEDGQREQRRGQKTCNESEERNGASGKDQSERQSFPVVMWPRDGARRESLGSSLSPPHVRSQAML